MLNLTTCCVDWPAGGGGELKNCQGDQEISPCVHPFVLVVAVIALILTFQSYLLFSNVLTVCQTMPIPGPCEENLSS